MTSESLLSVSFAAAALFVSLVALYAQFFRRRVRVVGVLVDKDYGRCPGWFQYALVNTGDMQILLRKVACEAATATFLTTCLEVPCVIGPGEVKLLKLEIDRPGELEPVGVLFAGVSAKGTLFKAMHSVAGSGLRFPMDGPYWDVFRIVG